MGANRFASVLLFPPPTIVYGARGPSAGRPEGLCRAEPLDDRTTARRRTDADYERERDRGKQSLSHGGDEQSDSESAQRAAWCTDRSPEAGRAGAFLESARQAALAGTGEEISGAAGDRDRLRTSANLDEDDAALDAYNALLSRLNGRER